MIGKEGAFPPFVETSAKVRFQVQGKVCLNVRDGAQSGPRSNPRCHAV